MKRQDTRDFILFVAVGFGNCRVLLTESFVEASSLCWSKVVMKLYAFFWVSPWRLNFVGRSFGTLCSIFIGRWLCKE